MSLPRAFDLRLDSLEAVLQPLHLEGAPDDTTLIRWANVIGSETVASLNDRAVELARSLI
jgi:hypothetical protein